MKTLKPGKCLQITFVSLPDRPYLCTKSTVAGPILSCLFYLLNPISQCPLTLQEGGLSQFCLMRRGIDTSVFKARSARGSSVTNAYKRGVPRAEILRTADWTNARTFRKYYIRE